jgi:hypothetical protein
MKTKKQLLHRIRQITNKHMHDTDSMMKILEPHEYEGDTIMFLDLASAASEVYDLLKDYVDRFGGLPD